MVAGRAATTRPLRTRAANIPWSLRNSTLFILLALVVLINQTNASKQFFSSIFNHKRNKMGNSSSHKSTSAAAGSSSSGASKKAFIDDQIGANDIVIFSKSYCPYCKSTKQTLGKISGSSIKVVELDLVPGGQAMQDALLEKTGQRTVPNVFVKGQHLGGNDDTQAAAASGKLQAMLSNVRTFET